MECTGPPRLVVFALGRRPGIPGACLLTCLHLDVRLKPNILRAFKARLQQRKAEVAGTFVLVWNNSVFSQAWWCLPV